MSGNNGNSQSLKDVVKKVNNSSLSSIKSVVHGIVKIINDPKSNAKDLKEIIEIDPPLTGKVLRVANSTYYAPRSKIGEIMQAIVYIGFEALKELALNQKMCDIFQNGDTFEGYSRVSLWKHSVAVALLGKMIYRKEFRERGENAYAAGLLHGIGIIAEDQFYQDDFKRALTKSKEEKKNLSVTEKEVFGYDHAEIGMEISSSWNLPVELVETIGFHHDPEKASPVSSKLVSTVYVADCLCQRNGIGFADAPHGNNALFKNCLEKLEIEPYALDLILGDLKNKISEMEAQGLI